jgi:hypothetical protein
MANQKEKEKEEEKEKLKMVIATKEIKPIMTTLKERGAKTTTNTD